MGTYVITGGASGIGLAIAEQLRSEGNRCLSLDIQEADIVADLSTAEGRTDAIGAIEAATGGELAGLVTSAGLGSHVPNKSLITSVNYYGTVELIAGLRPMLARNKAAVLLVSSNSAPMPTNPDFISALLEGNEQQAFALAEEMEGQPVYSGTKQAVTRWMRQNTQAYAAEGIRMNAIGPGYTRTPLSMAVEDDPTYSEAIKQFIASIPVGRPGVPQDMADAASFLLSDRAGFICGAMLYIDGGHDAMMRPESL
ncbi:SDR family oxidoreductase [Pseudohalioglobus lutimaris]|uniref:Short-chain dehydrogenase n=1 Tax=Pseudohalioglobus lutimaris TaxID=1737061 RepID=A0A2N5X2T4_9GAMM|nr:SDR family oxidoreductase [Pseudohalioglobus lutimaris]PLW68795.1 short-chain dehydrogenase [Pseudohalioglobus lutimaris]